MSSENLKPSVENPPIKYNKDGIMLDNPALKGLSRYFNSTTIRGRTNSGKATVAGFLALYIYMKFKNSGHQPHKPSSE